MIVNSLRGCVNFGRNRIPLIYKAAGMTIKVSLKIFE